MKKFISLILVFMCICGIAYAQQPATPTDLTEIDDWGEINIEFERQIFLSVKKIAGYFGDTVILQLTLINFDDVTYTLYWQYSSDLEEWNNYLDEHDLTLEFVVTRENCHYWWRALAIVEEE